MKSPLIKTLFFAVASLFSIHASAMQLNIILGDEIVRHPDDKLHLSYEIYTKANDGSNDTRVQSLRGLSIPFFPTWLRNLNDSLHTVIPGDSIDGKHSRLTLGLNHGGTTVFPDSCEGILLQAVTTVIFTPTACTVSY